ncbi:ABC transporter permease [Paenibacillus frigoriresistens]|uniref:ABC transporter permease n=1 Tax=Paenibacillus alginolyticus TaxID=59839 RepID=UPI001563D0F2|nr:ABC transporter permease [Paenibacillus frigoriresistens]NRF92907.1 ABC transporter permease [Paenibacillus frigoriresistens]
MVNLLLNENMKIYQRLRTWLLILGLILTTIGFLIAQTYSVKPSQVASADWKINMQQQIQNDTQLLNNMNRGPDWKARITSRINMNQYHIDHNIPPTEETLWGNMLNAADLMIVVSVMTVIIAADSVAGEFTDGTIKLLLIRPASRAKILLSKYISTFTFSIVLFVILFITAFLVSGILHGFHDMSAPYIYASSDTIAHETNIVQHAISTYLYQCIQMVMIVTMAFMISTVSRSSSIAIALSVGILFAGTSIVGFLAQYNWAKFYLFENTDLTQYLNGSPNIASMTLPFSVTVIVVYFIIFNVLSWLVFRKKDVTA